MARFNFICPFPAGIEKLNQKSNTSSKKKVVLQIQKKMQFRPGPKEKPMNN